VVSRLAIGWPLRSTLDRSRGAECIALRCTGAGFGWYPLPLTIGFPLIDVILLFVPFAGEARRVVADPALVVGTCTISTGGSADWEEMLEIIVDLGVS
jgi:hypothetical protein